MQVFFQGQFINDFIYKISLQYFFLCINNIVNLIYIR
jgi:hypothetical protein